MENMDTSVDNQPSTEVDNTDKVASPLKNCENALEAGNGDQSNEPDSDKVTENNDEPLSEAENNNVEADVDKPRGKKRKATENGTGVGEAAGVDGVEQDNVDFQKSDDQGDPSLSTLSPAEIMGKGKRARIPNKRYSDVVLSPGRKGSKSADSESDLSVKVKEESLDSTDSGSLASPTLPKRSKTLSKDDLQDPKYLKPFKFGWRRELVWRTAGFKKIADVIYFTPQGKKVKSFREVADNLTNKNLTLDNFTFTKEALGLDDPQKETVREEEKKVEKAKKAAKVSGVDTPVKASTETAPTTSTGSGRRRAAAAGVAKVVEKVARERPERASAVNANKSLTQNSKSAKKGGRLSKRQRLSSKEDILDETPLLTRQTKASKPCQPCSIICDGLRGVIPTLQCHLCLCLYHHECVGSSSSIYPYVCKNCEDDEQPSSLAETTRITDAVESTENSAPDPPKSTENRSLVGSVTSWLNPNVKIVNNVECSAIPKPQYVEFMNGRKFLIIPKHNFMSVSASSLISRAENSSLPTQPTDAPVIASASLGPSVAQVEVKSEEDLEAKEDENEASLSKVQSDVPTAKKHLKLVSITQTHSNSQLEERTDTKFMENYLQNLSFGYSTMMYVFQYLKVQDLLRAGRVCTMWRDIASHSLLWKTVRMKNSQVHSFEGLANTLKKHGTLHLDLRKVLLPSNGEKLWPEFSRVIAKVDTLRKIELCRCPASVVEQLGVTNTDLEVINAVTLKCDKLDMNLFGNLKNIREMRLRESTSGLNINSLEALKNLNTLTVLSLTSVNKLSKHDLSVIGELKQLESLDLGECTDFPESFGKEVLPQLEKLEKLRLEKGQNACHIQEILETVKNMRHLEQLELVNFDVKPGFDKWLGGCTNLKKLMIIPTYISQSATTNNMVLAAVLRLKGNLTHFVWGVTLELLRVTELFVDQCEDSKESKKEKKSSGGGDSIPVLKPVPDLTNGLDIEESDAPPQVEILPLPNLQKLLLNSLPTTRVKILKIPFHATWRQTLNDSV